MVYLRLEGLKISDALFKIARYCPKLLHLSLNSCICLTNRCITEIMRSCQKLRSLELGNCSIGNETIEEIARNCTNLKYLSLEGCKGISEEVMKKLNPKIKIEYPDYSDEKWSDSDLPLPIPMFTGTLLDETDLISALSNCIREIGGINPNHSIWFTNNYM
ncbi:4079_t:CDS:2 [Entrophospora sp. SA101]|nr:4079_t:CDS:2 [Entrophospora sp. SA101]